MAYREYEPGLLVKQFEEAQDNDPLADGRFSKLIDFLADAGGNVFRSEFKEELEKIHPILSHYYKEIESPGSPELTAPSSDKDGSSDLIKFFNQGNLAAQIRPSEQVNGQLIH